MVSTHGRKQGKTGRNLKAIRLEKRRRCEKYLKELLAKKDKREYVLLPKTPLEYEYEAYEPDLPCSAWQDYLNCFYEESESDQSFKNLYGEKSTESTVANSLDDAAQGKLKYDQYEKLLASDSGVKIKEEKLDSKDLDTNTPEEVSEKEETDFEWSDSEINNLFTTVKQIDESDSKDEEEEDDPIMEADLAFNFKHSKRDKFEYRSFLSPFEVKFVLNEKIAAKKSSRTDLRSSDIGVEGGKSYYQKHRRKKNLGPRPYQCSMCGARFMTKSNLKAHSEIVHSDERNHECEDCGLKFKTKYHLKTHCMNIHKKYKSLTAAANETRYPKRERMKITDKFTFTCSLCGVVLNNRRLLNMHMVVAHTKKGPKKSGLKNLKSISKMNSGRKTYNLREMVDYEQPVKRIVRRPPSPSEEIRIFDCNDCSAFYSSKCLLKNHILENHLFYHCEVANCGLVFKKKANLQRHNHRVHSKETPMKKVTRKKKKQKNLHRRQHKSKTSVFAAKFECDYCKVTFVYKKVLLRHILQYHPFESKNSSTSRYSGVILKPKKQRPGRPLDPTISQRRHKCQQCPMAFKTRSHLQAHILQRHSEERRFVCPICNAKFKMNGILKTHMLRLHNS